MLLDTYTVRLVFTEPILGTVPKAKEIYADFIASKAPTVEAGNEEVETVTEIEERGWTGFHAVDGREFLFDYAVKGHLKDVANVLKDQIGVKNMKSKVENFVFIFPRRIFFEDASANEPLKKDVLERPLRAQTAQGPRTALVRSDTFEQAAITFQIRLLKNKEITEDQVKALFEYGDLRGLGQWRNGGYGRYRLDKFHVQT